MSKEHIWSDWLKNILPPQNQHQHQKIRTTYDRLNKKCYIIPIVEKERKGALSQRKIRKVCKSCNGGWLSNIVNNAKLSVEKLTNGEKIILNNKLQSDLACWIIATSMMAEFTDQPTAGVPKSDFVELYKTKSPLKLWNIAIAKYEGDKWSPHRYRHIGAKFSIPGPHGIPYSDPDKMQITTFVLGAFIVYAFSSTDLSTVESFRNRSSFKSLIQLFPFTHDDIDSSFLPVINDLKLMEISDDYRWLLHE